MARPADRLYLDFVTLFLRGEPRWRLAGQLQFQFLDEQLGVGRRLCVAGQNQPSLIHGRNPDIDHFDFGQVLQHRRGRQSGAMVFYNTEVAMILAVFFAMDAAQKHAESRLPEVRGQREDTWSSLYRFFRHPR